MRIACIFTLFLGLISRTISYTTEALLDQVVELTGLEHDINFNQFSGYLQLSGTSKHIHYWLAESESNPSTSPLVFWTNGGPGCSGLIGFLTEQGPFRPDANGQLQMNDWRWNKIANMVFLEQPVGVGFSYSDNQDDYRIGDDQAAKDNLQTILAFLKKFPEFANSPLFITSGMTDCAINRFAVSSISSKRSTFAASIGIFPAARAASLASLAAFVRQSFASITSILSTPSRKAS